MPRSVSRARLLSEPLPLPEEAVRRAYGASRVSYARRLIAGTVATMPGAFTVEGLHARLERVGAGVGLATVYRAVAAMLNTCFLAGVGTRNGVALYACCAGGGHHHHLVCTGCGVVAPVGCPLDAGLEKAASHSGFTITGHEVVLYGLCAECDDGRPASAPTSHGGVR